MPQTGSEEHRERMGRYTGRKSGHVRVLVSVGMIVMMRMEMATVTMTMKKKTAGDTGRHNRVAKSTGRQWGDQPA